MPAINSNAGNTKVLFLGLLALIAALSLEFRNRSTVRRDLAHKSALRAESEMVLESVAARLRNAETCTPALNGETITPGETSPITLHFEYDKDLMAGGISVTEGGIKLAALDLAVPNSEDMRTTVNDVNGVALELWRFPVKLQAQFVSQKDEPLPLARNFPEGVPLFIWTLPPPPMGTGQIVSCFTKESSAFLCNEIGGYFQPNAKPYDQSCRLSLKTLKRAEKGLAPKPNCRLGGIAAKPSECPKFGVKFGADQIEGQAKLVAFPGNTYLCQVCQ